MHKLLLLLPLLLLSACASEADSRREKLEAQEVEKMWTVYTYPIITMIKVVDTGECFLVTANGGITSAYCTNPIE